MKNNKYEPLVSVVIPAYNASNYLREAINSALEQTYKNLEIIVVNDGSEDNGATAKIAHSYSDRIRYFEKENGGSSSAINVGIANMKGEWFSWLSHDDLYYPDKIQSEVDLINELGLNIEDTEELQRHIFVASADLIDAEGRIIQKFSKSRIRRTDQKINRPDGSLFLIAEPIQAGFHGCSCLIHRKAFEKIGGFNEELRLLNDMELWFRFYSNGYVVHYLPKVLVKGRVHKAQVSRRIGFSYHNPEQDAFWENNLNWLIENYPLRQELFVLYGKTAFKKTRYQDGERAFAHLKGLEGSDNYSLTLVKVWCTLVAKQRELLKKIYLSAKV